MQPKHIPLPIGVRGRMANESLFAAIILTSLLALASVAMCLFSFTNGEKSLGSVMALIAFSMMLQATIFNNKRQELAAFKASN